MNIVKHQKARNVYKIAGFQPIHGIAEGWLIRHVTGTDTVSIWNERIPSADFEKDFSDIGGIEDGNINQAAGYIVAAARDSDDLAKKVAAGLVRQSA